MKPKMPFLMGTLIAAWLLLTAGAASGAVTTQFQWARVLSTPQLESSSHGLDADAAGNVYVVGDTWGNLFAPPQSSENAFLAKYSPAGNLLWGIQTTSSSYFDSVNSSQPGFVYASGNGGLKKYNATDGSLVWTKNIDAGTGSPVFDRDGNIYVCGQASGGNTSVSKLDSSGNWKWTSTIPTLHTMTACLALDSSGNPVVLSTGLDSGTGHVYEVGYVAKFDTAGQVLWSSQIGASTGIATTSNIVTDSSGAVYVAGGTSQSLMGEAVTKYGYLIKYDSSGNAQWISRYNYPTGQGTGLGIDPTGALCVLGNGAKLFRYDSMGNPLDTIAGISAANDATIRDFVFSQTTLYTMGEANGPGTFDVYVNAFTVPSLPEPSTLVLLGISALGLLGHVWRKWR